VLVETIIDEALKLGYTHMRLYTLPGLMDTAIALYRSFGFVEIGPYYENPVEGAKFMELELLTTSQGATIHAKDSSRDRERSGRN